MFNNLLLTALTVIPPETLSYEKWQGNTTNEIGFDVPSYSDPVLVKGSIQYHIAEKMYQAFGLSLNKHYALVNLPASVVGLEESLTPDRLTFHGKKWIIIKNNNWHTYNGWCKVIVVEEKDYNGGEDDSQN